MAAIVNNQGTASYTEVLEHILDRGMVLDGMSVLAALAGSPRLSATATMIAANEGPRSKRIAISLLCPPRSRERNID